MSENKLKLVFTALCFVAALAILLQVRTFHALLHSVGRGGLEVRTSDSQSREPGFESSCCRVESWKISFTPQTRTRI